MLESQCTVFYLGKDIFTAKIANVVFKTEGLKINNPIVSENSIGDISPADIVILDHPEQIIPDPQISQVLLSSEPVNNEYLTLWCRTPMAEHHAANILFYHAKDQLLLNKNHGSFSYSTKRLHSFLEDDEEGIREIVAEFIDNLNTNYRNLETAIRGKNHQNIQQYAHKMLAGAKFYEAHELAGILRKLETESHHYEAELNSMQQVIFKQVILLRSALIVEFF